MLAISVDAIISCDEERRIILFNQGAERIFGYAAAEIVGRSLDLLLPEAMRVRHATHMASFATSESTARRMGERARIVGLRKNGEIFPAEASISRVPAGAGWRFTVMLRDVTERQRMEEGLRAAVAARDQVLAVVSHDLRNPLSAIKMCTAALEASLPAETTVAGPLLATIRESTDWMQRIIQDLLDVASLDAGRLSLHRGTQSIERLLDHAVELFRPLADEHGIGLDAGYARENLPDVVVDGERILQVLSNLIGNACKFTPRGGRVSIGVTREGTGVRVWVRDTGCGIEPAHLERVFDRFWHASDAGQVRSTGLGLAIAKGIVEAHGGRIWVESARHRGSTFSFTLPSGLPERVSDNP
jgi:PAS domain S-box-containing protein